MNMGTKQDKLSFESLSWWQQTSRQYQIEFKDTQQTDDNECVKLAFFLGMKKMKLIFRSQ